MIAIKKDAMRYRDPETGKFVGVSLIGGDAPSVGTPVELDTTLTQSGKAADAKAVGDQLSALNQANAAQDTRLTKLEQSAPSGTSGLTVAQVNALNGMFKVAAYIKSDVSAEYSAFKTAFGIEDSGETEPEKTLTSISAAYSGGNVAVGTSLDALTGIIVTATYSDGSTATVTGYTLSGSIAEGANTITVSYGGATATFTVTGVSESGGDEPVAGVLYSLPSATEFDGATVSIDTGVNLTAQDIDFTIAYTEKHETDGLTSGHVWGNQVDSYGYSVYQVAARAYRAFAYNTKTGVEATSAAGNINRFVFTHKAGSGILTTRYKSLDGTGKTYTTAYTWSALDRPIVLGCKVASDGTKSEYWKGRMVDFTIYDSVLSDREILAYLGGKTNVVASYDLSNLTVINAATTASNNQIVLTQNYASSRRSFVLTSGEKSCKLNDTSTDSMYYPIPIPSGAETVIVEIEPNTQYVGVTQYVLDSNADTYTKGVETGWVESSGMLSLNSSSTHISVCSKYNSAGGTYQEEPTSLTITFY